MNANWPARIGDLESGQFSAPIREPACVRQKASTRIRSQTGGFIGQLNSSAACRAVTVLVSLSELTMESGMIRSRIM